MIAPSRVEKKNKTKRWHWFSKSVRFEDISNDAIVFCKPKSCRFLRMRRIGKCAAEDGIIKAKTEQSVVAKFGDIPGGARIALKEVVRRSSDVRVFMHIRGDERLPIRRKDSNVWEYSQFKDSRGEDVTLKRIAIEPRWGLDYFCDCEYSDLIASLDVARLKKIAKATVAIGIACAIGATAYFSDWNHEELKIDRQVKSKQRTVEHRPATNKYVQTRQTTVPKASKLGYENGVEILALSVRTNNAGAVIEKLKLTDGTSKTKVHPKPPLFKNPCDQVIAMAISTKPGDAMPPLPDLAGIDQDFANSLLSPIVINDDDSDEVKNIKEMVIEVRKTLVEEVKHGGTVMDVLMAHQAEMNRIYESRLDAILMMQKICADDGMDAAQVFADAVNNKFEKEGIPAIPVVGRGRNQHRTDKK